ncbi:hypothetical protein F4604DRAFT_1918096 [Suillus subluteus]|nr:hypothetical protein F4604DRAFT_1918096 [Suillus subluteus]
MSTEEPEDTQGSRVPNTRPKRNANTFHPSNRSIPDLINDPATQSSVKDENTACAELEKKLLLTPAAEITLDFLTTALLDFSVQAHSLTPMHVDILRAMAILLFKTDHNRKANILANSINTLLEEPINHLEKLAGTHTKRSNKIPVLQKTIKRVEEAADGVYSSIADIKNAIEVIAPSINSLQSQVKDLNSKTLSTLTQQPATSRPSYSSITAAHLPPMVDQAIARAAIRAHQILLDPNPGTQLFPPNSSSSDIAAKLGEAITHIRQDDTPTSNIKAILPLCNGSIIVELDNESLANWLCAPPGKNALTEHLGLSASIRMQTFSIVAQYLPINLHLKDDNLLCKTEVDNNIPENSIISMHWIKPPKC